MSTELQAQRSFNRYELKYAVEVEKLDALAQTLCTRLAPDNHGVDGCYNVWSRYYDTEDLRFYWEKIDGIRFRRKLRVRVYGDPSNLTDTTPVFAEIKQRVNRVTQKRRVRLTYRAALAMCDDGTEPTDATWNPDVQDSATSSEILGMTTDLELRATAIVGYTRRAFVGDERDAGVRVTFDTNIRGRDVDLTLDGGTTGLSIVPPHLSVVEVKVNERVPYWMSEMIGRHNLQLVRVSKYCQAIERFGRAPRSSLPFNRLNNPTSRED